MSAGGAPELDREQMLLAVDVDRRVREVDRHPGAVATDARAHVGDGAPAGEHGTAQAARTGEGGAVLMSGSP